MTDWYELQGRRLDRMIADILGYTMYHYDKDVAERCYWQLWDEKGNVAAMRTNPETMGYWRTPAEHRTEEDAWEDMPQWSSREDHAVWLAEYSKDFTLQKRDGLWIASFHPQVVFTGEIGFKHADMALTIAVNFYQWASAGYYRRAA